MFSLHFEVHMKLNLCLMSTPNILFSPSWTEHLFQHHLILNVFKGETGFHILMGSVLYALSTRYKKKGGGGGGGGGVDVGSGYQD